MEDQHQHLKADDITKPSQPQTLAADQVLEDQPSDTASAAIETALGFRVGAWGLLLDSHIFCEIVDHNKISLLPNVQPWFNGVLNLRGTIVPVIDLHILFNEEKSANSKSRNLLAVDRGKKTMAFWIDGYPQMINTELLKNSPTPDDLPEVLKKATSACHIAEAQTWLNISLEKLFKALDSQTIQTRV